VKNSSGLQFPNDSGQWLNVSNEYAVLPVLPRLGVASMLTVLVRRYLSMVAHIYVVDE